LRTEGDPLKFRGRIKAFATDIGGYLGQMFHLCRFIASLLLGVGKVLDVLFMG